MKNLFAFVLTIISATSFAQTVTIDDLSLINLNVNEAMTVPHLIHQPNYRLGGGNAPGRRILDCLILDIQHSDVELTLDEKQAVAQQLEVTHGLSVVNRIKLETAVKGNNVVFLMPPVRFYVTGLLVSSINGRPLKGVVSEALPESRDGQNIPVGLIYVRDCRL